MELVKATKSEMIRHKLIMFKAKAIDQRFKLNDALKRTKNSQTKELLEFNIGVLNRHIERCFKLTQSKVLLDANPNNSQDDFKNMIIVGFLNRERIEFDVKNMERLRTMKKQETA